LCDAPAFFGIVSVIVAIDMGALIALEPISAV
jgi:hypothetical protein